MAFDVAGFLFFGVEVFDFGLLIGVGDAAAVEVELVVAVAGLGDLEWGNKGKQVKISRLGYYQKIPAHKKFKFKKKRK